MLTSQVVNEVNAGIREYSRVLESLTWEERLQAFSLSQVRIQSEYDIHNWVRMIGIALGYNNQNLPRVKTHGKRGRAAANTEKNILLFPRWKGTTVYTIVHEYAHLLNTELEKKRMEYRMAGKNLPIHGITFIETLKMVLSAVVDNSESLGIRILSADEVRYGY